MEGPMVVTILFLVRLIIPFALLVLLGSLVELRSRRLNP
jgi:hypothetical protein